MSQLPDSEFSVATEPATAITTEDGGFFEWRRRLRDPGCISAMLIAVYNMIATFGVHGQYAMRHGYEGSSGDPSYQMGYPFDISDVILAVALQILSFLLFFGRWKAAVVSLAIAVLLHSFYGFGWVPKF